MLKLKNLNLLVYTLIGILSLANLVGTNGLATQGVILEDLYSKTQELKKQNQELDIKINKLSNLSYLSQLAKTQGFHRIDQLIALSDSILVAEKPATIYP